MLETGLASLLGSDPTLAGFVGDRVTPVTMVGDCRPAITFHLIGGSTDPTFESSGLQKVRVQFDVWSSSYLQGAQVRDALRRFLNGFVGELADGTYIQNADLIQNLDFYEDDAREFRCGSEYYFYFTYNN